MVRPESTPVSEYITAEIEARGWSIDTFCEQSGLRRFTAEELLSGNRGVTKLIAFCLGRTFGTSAELWLKLDKEAAEAAGGK